MNTEVHEQTLACDGKHCAIHMVDEPDGETFCFECGHTWATWADLLADDNRVAAESGTPGASRVEDVWVCPFCTHDL
jgi:hypothetical protein